MHRIQLGVVRSAGQAERGAGGLVLWLTRALVAICAAVSVSSLAGCHHDKYNLAAKFEEDYVLPPDEPRFNNPPESGYKKPPKKKQEDIRNRPGGLNSGGFANGMNGNGF